MQPPEDVLYNVIAIQPKLYYKKLEIDYHHEGNIYFVGSILYRYGYKYMEETHFSRIFDLYDSGDYWYLNGYSILYELDGWSLL